MSESEQRNRKSGSGPGSGRRSKVSGDPQDKRRNYTGAEGERNPFQRRTRIGTAKPEENSKRNSSSDRPSRPYERRDDKPSFRDRSDSPARSPRRDDDRSRPPRSDDKPFRPREEGTGENKRPYKSSSSDSRPFRSREEGTGENKRPYKSASSDSRPFRSREEGASENKRPYKSSSSDSRPPRSNDRPSRPFEKRDDKPSFRDRKDSPARSPRRDDSSRPPRSDDKPFRSREEGAKKPFKSNRTDDKPAFRSDRPARPFSERGESTGKESTGEGRKPYVKKTFGDRPTTSDRPARPRSFEKSSGPGRTGSSSRKIAAPKNETGLIRLNKFLADAGVCSRREADVLITAGTVTVNGEVITELGHKVSIYDKVNYGGQTLNRETLRYVLLNKPKGYITTSDDPFDRKTVMELVTNACSERIYPVGRLDRNTTGLLLLTNDGELAKKLMHPRHGVSKLYHVELDKPITKQDILRIGEGVELEDGIAEVDEIAWVANAESKKEVGIQIHSGKNRIVRRIFESIGYEVIKLDRVIFAGLTKHNLPRSKWRHLLPKEISLLKGIK